MVPGAPAKCHQALLEGREASRALTCRTPTPPRAWPGWSHSAGSSPQCPRRWCSGCPSRAEARGARPEPTSEPRRAARCSGLSSAPTGRGEGGGRGKRRRRRGKGREEADLVAKPSTEPVLAEPLRSGKWRSGLLPPQGQPPGGGWVCGPSGPGRGAQRLWVTRWDTAPSSGRAPGRVPSTHPHPAGPWLPPLLPVTRFPPGWKPEVWVRCHPTQRPPATPAPAPRWWAPHFELLD